MARGKGTPRPGRRAPKGPVDTGTEGTEGRERTEGREGTEDCPEEVEVVGRAAETPSVGDDASLTLAGDEPQLVVGGRVAEILSTRPSLGVVTRCLRLGETYLGQVTDVSPEQFSARLTRRR